MRDHSGETFKCVSVSGQSVRYKILNQNFEPGSEFCPSVRDSKREARTTSREEKTNSGECMDTKLQHSTVTFLSVAKQSLGAHVKNHTPQT